MEIFRLPAKPITDLFLVFRLVNLELDTVSERSEVEDEDGADGSDQVGDKFYSIFTAFYGLLQHFCGTSTACAKMQ